MNKALATQILGKESVIWKGLFLIILIVPIVLHFFNLFQTIINYPNFGDDFVYVELIEHVNKYGMNETIQQIFKLHNHVHLIAGSKIFVLIAYFLTGNLNFRLLTIISNIQLLLILYVFFIYLKEKKYNKWHILVLAFLLFAPFSSIDNYSLLGSLTHTSSLLILVIISFLAEFNWKSKWLLFWVLIYPLCQTDGWMMILIFSIFCIFKEHPFRRIILIFLPIYFLSYIFILQEYPQTGFTIEKAKQIPLAFFVFLGNFVLPITDSKRLLLNGFGGILLFGLNAFLLVKRGFLKNLISLPSIIILQIFAIAFLVCLGRGSSYDLTTLVLGDRFYTYSTIALISTYILIIPIIEKQKTLKIFIIVSLFYYLGSAIFFIQVRKNLNSRLISDYTNAFHVQHCLSYSIEPKILKSLISAPFFQLDSMNLLSYESQFVSPNLVKPLSPKFEFQKNHVNIHWSPSILKNDYLNQQWLIIQKKENPHDFIVLPFLWNKYLSSNLVTINSSSFKNMKNSQFFLFSLDEFQKEQVKYLGDL